MPTATWEAALRVHKALGIERGIIVQTTTYGADHSVVLDALAAMGPNYRGCANALVFAEANDAYLAKLHDAGVRGARFSFRQELGAVLSDADFARAIARIRELGWYAKIQPEKDVIVSSVAKYEALDVPVLIDHMHGPIRHAERTTQNCARCWSSCRGAISG
jgi:2-pyrone-4,6-dicarboxylate lactonase